MNALLPYWLKLTGGESGCPRARFALTMLAAYGLYHLVMPLFVHCFITLNLHGMPGSFAHPGALLAIIGMVMALVSLLFAFLPLSPVALLGFESNIYKGYELLQGATSPGIPAPDSLWPYWLGFFFGSLVLLLAGAVALGAAWRRLRDAGRSPLFLLLGLTYLLGFGSSGFAADASGIYLLGPLWLIILYSQPTAEKRDFVLFRNPPAENSPTVPPLQQSAPAATNGQRARQKETVVRLTSRQKARGNRPSQPNGAGSYRRRMRERVQAARRRG